MTLLRQKGGVVLNNGSLVVCRKEHQHLVTKIRAIHQRVEIRKLET
jgi:hypothetical protein